MAWVSTPQRNSAVDCAEVPCWLLSPHVSRSLSAVIDNSIFAVHGGLSPTISTLDQVGPGHGLVRGGAERVRGRRGAAWLGPEAFPQGWKLPARRGCRKRGDVSWVQEARKGCGRRRSPVLGCTGSNTFTQQLCSQPGLAVRASAVPWDLGAPQTAWGLLRAGFYVMTNSPGALLLPAQIRTIDRKQEVPHDGAMCDLLWSDPEDIEGWGLSPRGAGFLFGADVCRAFTETNKIDLICRRAQTGRRQGAAGGGGGREGFLGPRSPLASGATSARLALGRPLALGHQASCAGACWQVCSSPPQLAFTRRTVAPCPCSSSLPSIPARHPCTEFALPPRCPAPPPGPTSW